MKNEEPGLEEIWRKGCQDELTEPAHKKRFAAMARSRFHTFQMGIQHAGSDSGDDNSAGLVSGLAKELFDNPGLRKTWEQMAASKTEIGEQVSLLLEKLDEPFVH